MTYAKQPTIIESGLTSGLYVIEGEVRGERQRIMVNLFTDGQRKADLAYSNLARKMNRA